MRTANSENSLIPYKRVGIIEELGGAPWRENISGKILRESAEKLTPGTQSTLDTIENLIVNLVTTIESDQRGGARMQIRLLGNYLRILSHRSPEVKEFTKQLTWGIDAGALDNSCSGEQEAAHTVMEYLSSKNGNNRLNVFDVGANKGAWTLQIANLAKMLIYTHLNPTRTLSRT